MTLCSSPQLIASRARLEQPLIMPRALRCAVAVGAVVVVHSTPVPGKAQPYSPQSLSFSVTADAEVVREDCRFSLKTEPPPDDDQARAFRVGRMFDAPVTCAPRAILVDTLTDAVLFERAADEQTLQGSISKILTAGVALSAARDGIVALDDPVAISERAREQCTCIQDDDGDGVSDVQIGETFLLDSLLHASLMLSAGEATDAVAEHVAAAMIDFAMSRPNKPVSELLMNYFLGLMNERAAEIALSDQSRFVTVHGGDVCNFATRCAPDWAPDCEGLPCLLSFFLIAVCGTPEAEEADFCRCNENTLCEPSGTTARDLATLWRDIATETPEFVEIAGRRNITIPSAVGGQLNAYELSQSFPYSPGVDADKGGNSEWSRASLISQTTWLGRTLVGVVLNGPDNTARGADMGALFDFGYTAIFEPHLRGTSQPLQAVHDHDLVCASQNRAISAFIRESERDLGVVTWDVDVGSGAIVPLGTTISADDGFTPAVFAEEVDATHMGGGIIVVAVRRGGGVDLMTWGIAANGPPFIINGGVPLGQGTDVRVEALTDRVLVSALRNTQGRMILRTWSVSADGTTIEPLDTAPQHPDVREFDLSTLALGLTGRVLTVLFRNNRRVVLSWVVDLHGGTVGEINLVQTDIGPEVSKVVSATGVPMRLESPFDAAFVTADRTTGGKLRLALWSVEPAGDLAFLGDSGSAGPDLALDDRIRLVPMREAGVFSVVGDGLHARVTVWGLDPDNPSDGFATPFIVVDGSQVAGQLLGTCLVPSHDAEGDVLLAYEHFFDQGQPLTLSSWRSGPRP